MRSSCEASREEAAQALLGRRALREGRLDLPEHAVEREPEAADLGALRGGLDAPGEVAGGDRARRPPHPLQRREAEPDQPPRGGGQREQDERGDDEQDAQQVAERLVGLGERDGGDERVRRRAALTAIDAVAVGVDRARVVERRWSAGARPGRSGASFVSEPKPSVVVSTTLPSASRTAP